MEGEGKREFLKNSRSHIRMFKNAGGKGTSKSTCKGGRNNDEGGTIE